jgi:hypothetical protein
MSKPHYPNITDAFLTPIRAIEVQTATFPDILDRPECPYSPEVKSFLRKLFSIEKASAPAKEYSEDELVGEISALYEELKGVDVKADPKDMISLLKARGDLLTKLVTQKEKALNIRDVAHFQRTVVEVLEHIVSPAQRNEFLERLKDYV